jgi:hypothetical protein
MVAHICNPSYLGGRDWKGCYWRPVRAKVQETRISTNKKLSVVLYAYYPSYIGSWDGQVIKARPYLKNNDSKKGLVKRLKWLSACS